VTTVPPLGVRHGVEGTTFAVLSGSASSIDLCLFDERGREERVPLTHRAGMTWWAAPGHVPAGTRYGYRVSGPEPADHAKLLLDPYVEAVEGTVRWDGALHRRGEDSAPFVPRGLVLAPPGSRPVERDVRPRVAWSDTVVYEANVRNLTMRHPSVPAAERGTYLGLSHPSVIDHLVGLGVTTLELLPLQQFVDGEHLVRAGLRNLWGYDPVAFLAPHNGYAASAAPGAAVPELRAAVRALHDAGIEVVVDLVVNHTAEGGSDGPTLGLRGFDESAYYVVDGRGPVDETGCGNTLDLRAPAALRLVLDTMRHWVLVHGVDGFRFDLAAVLGRQGPDRAFSAGGALFAAIWADPVLAGIKLIAEPWDLGPHGYQLGHFPPEWAEWNGRFRDTVRDFWRGAPSTVAPLAEALTGTAERFRSPGRAPQASVNFVTCHDGFTLADLVTYERKRNEANQEDNRDGTDDNRSWNCGIEGPTERADVLALRARQRRNLLATVLVSCGVPMLCGGDELGRTQRGNNNAYCQDNDVSWFDWAHADADLTRFVADLVALRRDLPVFRRNAWSTGTADTFGVVDIAWFDVDGRPMADASWHRADLHAVAMRHDGRICGPDAASVLVLCNAQGNRLLFRVPEGDPVPTWWRLVDTAAADPSGAIGAGRPVAPGDRVRVDAHSLVVLVGPPGAAANADHRP